jgi:hypothetical protein
MDEQSTHQAQPEPQVDFSDSRRSGLAVFLFCAVGILLIYILSIGPVLNLAAKAYISAITANKPRPKAFPAISTVYYPIFRVCDACHPAGRCLNWYLRKVSHTNVAFAPDHTTMYVLLPRR